MDNAYDTMRAAIREARTTMRAADDAAGVLADILAGRLRHVPAHTLVKLKRELRDFDMHRKEWKQTNA